MDAAAGQLLNFSEPLDVGLLDATVSSFYVASSKEQVGNLSQISRLCRFLRTMSLYRAACFLAAEDGRGGGVEKIPRTPGRLDSGRCDPGVVSEPAIQIFWSPGGVMSGSCETRLMLWHDLSQCPPWDGERRLSFILNALVGAGGGHQDAMGSASGGAARGAEDVCQQHDHQAFHRRTRFPTGAGVPQQAQPRSC